MELTLLEHRNYLKGLLILIGKDKDINKSEKAPFRDLAAKLGFASEFYNQVSDELLENEYLIEDQRYSLLKKLLNFLLEMG